MATGIAPVVSADLSLAKAGFMRFHFFSSLSFFLFLLQIDRT
jgi:hypothetical protein